MEDLKVFLKKTANLFSVAANIFRYVSKLFKRSPAPPTTTNKKSKIIDHIKLAIFPKAKLTYWLADEEVVVYITNFKQKDRYSLIYKEIETNRIVLVNSANPINYRLEQLKPGDQIEHTHIEQNQKY